MTPEGRFIVFRSRDPDLVSGVIDINLASDIFVRDTVLGTTQLVSINSTGGAAGDAGSGGASISADGRFIAFESDASNLVPNLVDTGQNNDIFVRDRVAGTTRIVSVDPTGLVVGDGGEDGS